MMYYKILIVQVLLTGAAICLPQTRNDTPDIDSSTTENIEETTTDLSTESSYENTQNNVLLTVYYETHCPFSVDFFVKQLKPAVLKLGSYLELDTVPYGLAETHEGVDENGAYTFSCDHGDIECHGNTVHACVLNHVKNKTQAVLYNSCLMSSSDDYTDLEITQCGVAEKVPVLTINNILRCVKGTQGSFLLKSYGEVTKLKRISSVPYVTFNEYLVLEDDTGDKLIAEICYLLDPRPAECP